MKSSVDVNLSTRATAIAKEFTDTGKFNYVIDVARLAMGYALRNYYNEFDPETYIMEDTEGSQYNIGSLDPDGNIKKLIKALYPDAESPLIYALRLMDYGLLKLGEIIDEKGMPDIYTLF